MLGSQDKITDSRPEIWEALADQFLDTETRVWIPRTALTIIEAGYRIDDAEIIWRYEVTPAVWPNGWNVAGEWAGFDRDWLETTIGRLRGRWPNRPGPFSAMIYRLRAQFIHGAWTAIAACMEALLSKSPRQRRGLAVDLTILAEHYFDFCTADPSKWSRDCRERLAAVFFETFLPIFPPMVVADSITGESVRTCAARVANALQL